ncbi:MAG: 4'-phosphopantetheinyl transferase superfamily protein [bacterium]|nr:4'-phosphopantetheinyl transferase superfamily protein [bacterium]
MNFNDWKIPPLHPELTGNEVHLWLIPQDDSGHKEKELRSVLAPDERERADRFHFERDRVRYTVSRAALRLILARYLHTDTPALEFSYSQYGKPSLVNMPDHENILFNMSHSGGMALCGITRKREIGVDIESIRFFDNADQIVERYFSDQEKIEYRQIPGHLKNEAFFTCWTRKEAYIKGIGQGLTHPLNSFTVSLTPEEPAMLLHLDDSAEKDRWTLKEITVGAGFVAAVAVEGDGWLLRYWDGRSLVLDF